MYPFVRLPKGMELEDPMTIFMSNIASTTILETMQGVCDLDYQTGDYFSPGEGPIRFYREVFDQSYFKDVGKHFRQSDEQVGLEIVSRKLQRMREKLTAWDYQEFDSFERFLFFSMLSVAYLDGRTKQKEAQEKHKKLEKKVRNTLIKTYGCKKGRAKKLTKHVCRTKKMVPKDWKPRNEGMNLYTSLDDYMQIWNYGFLNGLRFLSTLGSAMGYGYDSTLKLFSDIGVKPPLTLVGTREGNKIAAEVMMGQAMETFVQATGAFLDELKKNGIQTGNLGEEIELDLEELNRMLKNATGQALDELLGKSTNDLDLDDDLDDLDDSDDFDDDSDFTDLV